MHHSWFGPVTRENGSEHGVVRFLFFCGLVNPARFKMLPNVLAAGQTTAAFIDFGYCFNAAEWSFPDSPLRGVYARQEMYAHIDSWNNFEPWLSRIEGCSMGALEGIAEEIPSEWYGEPYDLDCLVDSLFER